MFKIILNGLIIRSSTNNNTTDIIVHVPTRSYVFNFKFVTASCLHHCYIYNIYEQVIEKNGGFKMLPKMSSHVRRRSKINIFPKDLQTYDFIHLHKKKYKNKIPTKTYHIFRKLFAW